MILLYSTIVVEYELVLFIPIRARIRFIFFLEILKSCAMHNTICIIHIIYYIASSRACAK